MNIESAVPVTHAHQSQAKPAPAQANGTELRPSNGAMDLGGSDEAPALEFASNGDVTQNTSSSNSGEFALDDGAVSARATTGTVYVCSGSEGFNARWSEGLRAAGLVLQPVALENLLTLNIDGAAVLLDASLEALDSDELLTTVGAATALQLTVAIDLNGGTDTDEVEDLLDEMCPGLVARSAADVTRIGQAIARRLDKGRSARFEFVTVSPRPNELLAILGDGRTALLSRPLDDRDDGSEVVAITLAEDARSAELELSSGATVILGVHAASRKSAQPSAQALSGSIALDGARLGARLRALRQEAGLTQAELARRTGIHRPNIARVEAGRHTPSLDTLARLASAIGVSATAVLMED